MELDQVLTYLVVILQYTLPTIYVLLGMALAGYLVVALADYLT